SPYDLYLVKFDSSGNHVWSRRFGDTGGFGAGSMAIDATNRICITGSMGGNINFGGGTLAPTTAPDIYLALFNPARNHLWSKHFGDAQNDEGTHVTFASNNDVLLTANAQGPGSLNFGGSALAAVDGFSTTFVARFFPNNGAHRWSAAFPGTDSNFGIA